MAEDLKHRTIRYLQDAHAAETGVDDVLKGFVNDTDDPTIKAFFENQAALARTQAQRIEAHLTAIGGDTSGAKGFMNMIFAKASEVLQGAHDPYDKNTQNLIKAYTTFHGQRGMYESLITWGRAIGDEAIVSLGTQLQAEEVSSAEDCFPAIASYANTALASTVASA